MPSGFVKICEMRKNPITLLFLLGCFIYFTIISAKGADLPAPGPCVGWVLTRPYSDLTPQRGWCLEAIRQLRDHFLREKLPVMAIKAQVMLIRVLINRDHFYSKQVHPEHSHHIRTNHVITAPCHYRSMPGH